jgi:TRAP transporter TAXI family solute receptor
VWRCPELLNRPPRAACVTVALIAACLIAPAAAEQAPPRTNRNIGAVGIISGGPGGTYIQMATDLSFVHDDLVKYTLRVVPMVGRGSVQNIDDLLFLKGVDFAIVQEDVLAHFALTEDGQRKAKQIRYVTRLHNEEVHVLARAGIARISDLAGRKVSVGAAGSGHALTASVLLRQYRISVEELSLDPATSLAKLRAGEIDAMIFVAGKPVALFQNLNRTDQVHFLPVDEPSLRDLYVDAELSPKDYRDLLDRPVRTVMVGAVLAAFGSFQDGSDRAKKSCAFVAQFFDKLHELRLPGRHAKWNEVDIHAGVKNWQRLGCAADWLKNNPQRDLCAGAKVDPTFLRIYRESLMDRYPAMRDTLRSWPDERLLDFLKDDRKLRSQQLSCIR